MGRLVLLYGACCLGPSFYRGELSWGELSLVRVVCNSKIQGAPVAQWVKHWPTDVGGHEFEPCSRRNILNRKRGSIAHSLSLSFAHRPDITEILLKRT